MNLEFQTFNQKDFIRNVEDLLAGREILKQSGDSQKKIASKNKLYFGNHYIEMRPYKDKSGNEKVLVAVGYLSANERFEIKRLKDEKENGNN